MRGQQIKTTYNPDFDPERPSYGKNDKNNQSHLRYSKAFERSKRRSETDFSLEFGQSHRMYTDQSNSNQKQPRKKFRDLSPNSKLIFRSESQFNQAAYGNSGARQSKNYEGNIPDENSFWDKLSRIFTFGCIETSHNKR